MLAIREPTTPPAFLAWEGRFVSPLRSSALRSLLVAVGLGFRGSKGSRVSASVPYPTESGVEVLDSAERLREWPTDLGRFILDDQELSHGLDGGGLSSSSSKEDIERTEGL